MIDSIERALNKRRAMNKRSGIAEGLSKINHLHNSLARFVAVRRLIKTKDEKTTMFTNLESKLLLGSLTVRGPTPRISFVRSNHFWNSEIAVTSTDLNILYL
ncbi:hypothetical protein EVAR_7665_1 [Eumeta japonica]|uniref:Uncharacterized protein n=1 Tax=Eumeta variegata TaxID=151549 RepID=A0A4C1TLQ7_EUMVA|nr:hypothetical protein EVAR_7665_1 [Eumeta japonica]